jgi:hypothetical protein
MEQDRHHFAKKAIGLIDVGKGQEKKTSRIILLTRALL